LSEVLGRRRIVPECFEEEAYVWWLKDSSRKVEKKCGDNSSGVSFIYQIWGKLVTVACFMED